MIRTVQNELGDLFEVRDTEAGMHFVGWLAPTVDDTCVSEEAAKVGLCVLPISEFALRRPSRGGLILGFAGFREEVIRAGIRDLGMVIKKCTHTARRVH